MTWLPDGKLPPEVSAHPAWQRLEDQQTYYSHKSAHNRRWYMGIKLCQIVLASTIPLLSLIEDKWGRWLMAGAGATIAILEAVQQLNQYSQLWIEYRLVAERLKRDKYLFLAGAGPYQDLDMPARLIALALRVEEVLSAEHEQWSASETQAAARKAAVEPSLAGALPPPHPDRTASH